MPHEFFENMPLELTKVVSLVSSASGVHILFLIVKYSFSNALIVVWFFHFSVDTSCPYNWKWCFQIVSKSRRITALSTLSLIFYTLPTVRRINNTQNHCCTNYEWEKWKTPSNELHALWYLQQTYNNIHIISRIVKVFQTNNFHLNVDLYYWNITRI